nr:6546_t:CDS:2 [Entrophospora candida]
MVNNSENVQIDNQNIKKYNEMKEKLKSIMNEWIEEQTKIIGENVDNQDFMDEMESLFKKVIKPLGNELVEEKFNLDNNLEKRISLEKTKNELEESLKKDKETKKEELDLDDLLKKHAKLIKNNEPQSEIEK